MSSKPLVLAGPHGRIEIAGAALDGLVGEALAPVEGVDLARGRRSVEIVGGEGTIAVDLQVTVGAAHALPDVGEQAQRAVASALNHTTGLVVAVDVAIVAVTT